MRQVFTRVPFVLQLLLLFALLPSLKSQQLQISHEFPQYWEYRGSPVLLLGASDEDNLFQMQGVKEHLDSLASAGGNYVRCTMSSRDEGNLWPFYYDTVAGRYDLDRWDEKYWQRFADFLEYTHQLEIFVQVEIWATFDFYRDPWSKNPFNPQNNNSYSAQRSELPDSIPTHPIYTDNPFFTSIPSHDNNMVVLQYQQKFVDRVLHHTLDYDHVLYCMDNETSVTASWGAFWSTYIRKMARESDKKIYCTEMWDPWDLDHISHRESFDHPELYQFVEISQNNHQRGDEHWSNGLRQIERLQKSNHLRPVTNIKIYGADGGRHGGGDQDAMEKFFRAILFGSASARFHRPTSGLGLNSKAVAAIRSARLMLKKVHFFEMHPLTEILSKRSENEAYVRGIADQEYVLYFTDGGDVALSLSDTWQIEWINISDVQLTSSSLERSIDGTLTLTCPSRGQWFAILKKI